MATSANVDLDRLPTRAQRLKRDLKRLIMRAAKTGGAFRPPGANPGPKLPILCYHGTWMGHDPFRGDAMFMRPEAFARRMALIERLGYSVISLDVAIAALSGDAFALPLKSVVITIDDGWYSTFHHMRPVLERHGFPATLYCDTAQLLRGGIVPHVFARYMRKLLGWSVLPPPAAAAYADATGAGVSYESRCEALERFAKAAGIDLSPYRQARAFEYMTPDELRTFANAGFDVQLHTHNHTMQDLTPGSVGSELAANAAALANVLERPAGTFQHFCYPSGVKNDIIADALRDNGIASATTTVAGLAAPNDHICLLPRIIDGGHMSEIEFEAELSGFAAWLRQAF